MRTVIIDAGHGKETPGKRSPEWALGVLHEWEFNRDIAKRVQELLAPSQVLTVVISDEEADTPLSERVREANAIHKADPGAFLISIHANAGGGEGFEVFTSVGKTKSDDYSKIMQAEFASSFKDWKIRKDDETGKESNFYILKNTTCPAMLLELGFMDNQKDYYRLMDPSFRHRLAMCIAQAILKIQNI